MKVLMGLPVNDYSLTIFSIYVLIVIISSLSLKFITLAKK